MAKQVVDKYGRIDILMTNAAVQPPGTIATMQVRHWELEFRVNVNGPFYCVRAVLPQMQAQHSGNIINISSVAADPGRGGHYGAGKRAIESMTIGLAAELKSQGIVVNCLKPVGGIATPGFMFGRQGRDTSGALPPDSYVEAAVLLALQTPESCTGEVFNDTEAVERFADATTKARLKAIAR
jgi:NAD(P)-dependent dehydrogenase (short-subunit alcohol dehydrogenase family)